eukprot:7139080-Pyramimonas_sp.AAC.1
MAPRVASRPRPQHEPPAQVHAPGGPAWRIGRRWSQQRAPLLLSRDRSSWQSHRPPTNVS